MSPQCSRVAGPARAPYVPSVPQSGTVSKSGWTTDGRTDVSETFCIIRMPTKDQGFTEDQVEDFKEVFQLFDTKGDGLIQVGKKDLCS